MGFHEGLFVRHEEERQKLDCVVDFLRVLEDGQTEKECAVHGK